MCENTIIVIYDPHGNINLTNDGSLHERAKELLTDFRANQSMIQTTIIVSQKALAGTLVSMCKKNYPNYGWVKVYDPYNALTNSKYLKHYVQSPIPEIS